jgi:hypothetical protein
MNKIIPTDYLTFMELMSFGKTKGGSYSGQNGNDDLAMTSVNLAPFFDSPQFWDLGVDTYENMPPTYRKEIEEKIFSIYRENNTKSLYNFEELKRLNTIQDTSVPNTKPTAVNVFDLESLEQMRKIKNRFFNS